MATATFISLTIPIQIHSDTGLALHSLTPLDVLSDTSTLPQIKSAISYVAVKYGVEDSELLKVIKCETDFVNTKKGLAGEIGIAQFMPDTWKRMNIERGTHLDIHSIRDQLDMITWAFKNGDQNQWTCWRRYFTH